jgi:hypothetical protein
VISRPRGWGKSPFLAAIACVEALGDVVAAGWDADGQPVGKPWSRVRTPYVQVAAVSETQTQNSWMPLLEMLRDGPVLDNYPGLDVLDTFVNLPRRGQIQRITSSPASVKGNKALFAILDQTEEWHKSNGGVKLAQTMRNNATKLGGTTVESPNAYVPGMGSVAETTAIYAKNIVERKAYDAGLLYDHREAPPTTDLTDPASLMAGLRFVYGDSAEEAGGWVDLIRIANDILDLSNDVQVSRMDFLNQITHASDSWLSQPEWNGAVDLSKVVAPRDMITLGFDGSRKRSHAVTDATALIGCRVRDGHLFEIAVWEQPDGPAGKGWQVPVEEVEAAVRQAFARWNVIGFYADPAKWETRVAAWEGRYSQRPGQQGGAGPGPVPYRGARSGVDARRRLHPGPPCDQRAAAGVEGRPHHREGLPRVTSEDRRRGGCGAGMAGAHGRGRRRGRRRVEPGVPGPPDPIAPSRMVRGPDGDRRVGALLPRLVDAAAVCPAGRSGAPHPAGPAAFLPSRRSAAAGGGRGRPRGVPGVAAQGPHQLRRADRGGNVGADHPQRVPHQPVQRRGR